MSSPLRNYLPAIIIFLILNAGFIILSSRFRSWGFDPNVLLIGNLVIFAISSISFLMGVKALRSKNHHAFFRLVYGSFMLKLVLLVAAAFTYISVMKKDVNKPALFFCMGLYLIYTFIEVSALMRSARKKTHV